MILAATDPKFRFIEFPDDEDSTKQSAKQYREQLLEYLRYTRSNKNFYGTLIAKNLLYFAQSVCNYLQLHIQLQFCLLVTGFVDSTRQY